MASEVVRCMSVIISKNALIAKDLIILQPIVKNRRGIRRHDEEHLEKVSNELLEEKELDEVVDKMNLYQKSMMR